MEWCICIILLSMRKPLPHDEDIKYAHIKYSCIMGGEFKSQSKGWRPARRLSRSSMNNAEQYKPSCKTNLVLLKTFKSYEDLGLVPKITKCMDPFHSNIASSSTHSYGTTNYSSPVKAYWDIYQNSSHILSPMPLKSYNLQPNKRRQRRLSLPELKNTVKIHSLIQSPQVKQQSYGTSLNSSQNMSDKTSWFPSIKATLPNVHPAKPDTEQKSSINSLHLCNMTSRSHVIAIPIKDKNGHQQHVLREVHPYPRNVIKTSVEKASHIRDSNVLHESSADTKITKKPIRHRTFSGNSSNTSSDISYTKYDPSLSDASSNLSELTGYEDEYTAIKNVLSGNATETISNEIARKQKSSKEPSILEVQYNQQESELRTALSQKEDLEIQLHRLSIQLQNAIREKELYQQQVDVLSMKATEVTQKQHFEIMKQNANLEGQQVMLKIQLEENYMDKKRLDEKLESAIFDLQLYKDKSLSLEEEKAKLCSSMSSAENNAKEFQSQIENFQRKFLDEQRLSLIKTKELEDLKTKFHDAQSSLDSQRTLNNGLKNELGELSIKNETISLKLTSVEKSLFDEKTKLGKLLLEKNSLENAKKWYEEQLLSTQSSKSVVQSELTELKGLMSVLSTEKTMAVQEISRLKNELGDLTQNSARDKTALLTHLEEVEANMKEREAALKVADPNAKHLNNQRLKELEQAQHLIKKQNLELQEIQRKNESIRDELSQKSSLVTQYETLISNLNKDKAILEENLHQIKSQLVDQQEKLSSLSESHEDFIKTIADKDLNLRQKDTLISKLEASLTLAKSTEKRDYDAIQKFKEDVTKMTSLYATMKKELLRANHEIDVHSSEKTELLSKISTLQQTISELTHQSKQDKHELESTVLDYSEKLSNLIESSKDNEYQISSQQQLIKKLETQLSVKQQNSELLECEKENYARECGKLQEKLTSMEEKLLSLGNVVSEQNERIKCFITDKESMHNKNMKLYEEIEELEAIQSRNARKIEDLEDNCKMERKLKQSFDEKYHASQKSSIASDKEWETKYTSIKSDLQAMQLECEQMKFGNDSLNIKDVIEQLELKFPQIKLHSVGNAIMSNGLSTRQLSFSKPTYKNSHKKIKNKYTMAVKSKNNKSLKNDRKIFMHRPIQVKSVVVRKQKKKIEEQCLSITPNEESIQSHQAAMNGIDEFSNDHVPCDNDTSEVLHTTVENRLYDSNIKLLIRKLKEHMKGRRAAEKDLRRVMKELKRKEKEAKERYNDLMNRFIHLEMQHQIELGTVDQLKTDNKILEKSAIDEKNEREYLQESNLALQRENSRMSELESICQRKQSIVSSLEEKIRQLKSEKESIMQEVTIFKKSKQVWETEKDFFKEELKKLQVMREHYMKEIKTKTEVIQMNESSIDSLHAENNNLSIKNEEMKDVIQRKKDSITSLENLLKDTKHLLEQKTSRIDELELECSQCSKKVQEIKLEKQDVCDKYKECKEQADSLSNELNIVKNEVNSLKCNNEKTTNELETRLNFMNSVESSLNNKIEELLRDKLFYQNHTTELKSALSSALQELKKLKNMSVSAAPLKGPPPLPLDNKALSNLLNQSNNIVAPASPLDSISKRLSLLRTEISSLQSHVNSRELGNVQLNNP